jgi:hypothetical protein
MKKTLLTIAATIAITTSASANDLTLDKVEFRTDADFAIKSFIDLTVTNHSDKEIIAFKGQVTCLDAFGDLAFVYRIKSTSANILPNATEIKTWSPEMFSEVGEVVGNNNAKNFKCSLGDLKIAN